MLQSLLIQNFILIEKLEIDFSSGMSVITGETGAGKSIILDAILFCLGEKASSNVVRHGTASCSVAIVFSTNPDIIEALKSLDIEVQDELILKRICSASGKNKFFINDELVSQKTIISLSDSLIEIYGQHTHTSLMNPSSHLNILDTYGQLLSFRLEVKSAYDSWQEQEKQISKIAKEKDQMLQEIDYLTHICKELEKESITLGEEENLTTLKQKLQGKDKEIKLIKTVLDEMESSHMSQSIGKMQRLISRSANSHDFATINKQLDEIYSNLQEVESSLHSLLSLDEYQEHNLEEIEDRLYKIRSLARKHNCSADELPAILITSEQKLNELQTKLNNSEELIVNSRVNKANYLELADILSAKRKEAAIELQHKTLTELAALQMQKASFIVEIASDHSNSSAYGVDKVRFVAATNPGTTAAAIDKIASGGELSRFMLAFSAALFDRNSKSAIIFDEIDVGISGLVADSIGDRLKCLSGAVQVIVITHQPQVAAKADKHILVRKDQHDNHTVVSARMLKPEEKLTEIARMISGKVITSTGINAAKELLG